MTLDCDVHQGNGTAVIFAGMRASTRAFAFALRFGSAPAAAGERAAPATYSPSRCTRKTTIRRGSRRHRSTSICPTTSRTTITWRWLDNALSSGLRQFQPDLLCYLAGADPYKEDQLGGLSLTIEGLKKRDELVFRVARAKGIPVMVTFAGGYAQNVEDTVTIHSNTVIAAKEVFAVTK